MKKTIIALACLFIATIAYRIVIFLNMSWAKVMWYIGTIGFILYFAHRAQVQNKRARLAKDNKLIGVVSGLKKVTQEQRDALNYLVKTAVRSKARVNSLFILWLTVAALIAGIVMDFIF